MRYHKITGPDIENGLGFRVSLWIAGCSLGCEGCHNPETHDFLGGREFTEETFEELCKALDEPYIKGLTLTGGNPMESSDDLVPYVIKLKEKFPNKDIWLYSGFTLHELQTSEIDSRKELLNLVDVVVDGPYLWRQRNLSLAFRGSENQKIYKNVNGTFVPYNI